MRASENRALRKKYWTHDRESEKRLEKAKW
jgi:hypothetical protein